ncbi:MAG: ferric reductase-like transmembrane domain-containing protein [Pirellula sp.]
MNSTKFFRSLVIFNGAVPLLVLAWDAYRGQLGANAVNYALHVTGILSLIFLVLSLAITPLRWITKWGGWVSFRRSLGLYGFFYAVLHLAIYVGLDREFNVASTWNELWTRRFLQVGAAALFLMVPLAATSTNSMVQRMGPKRWKLLHRLAYVVAVLGVVHYYMLVKSDVRQPIAFGVLVAILLSSRLVKHYLELRSTASKVRSPRAPTLRALSPSPVSPGNQAKRRNFWSGELKIAALFQETPDVKTFRLVATDGGPLPFDYLPGQYMNLKLEIDGKRINRSYTIASSPTRRDACELSIKRESSGIASRFLHDELNVGDTLNVSAPAGKFVFTGESSANVFLIAGGVGITPLMSMVRYLTDRAWAGDIYFLIVVKSEQDIIFREELEWLRKRFANLHVCITLTRSDSNSKWRGESGRPSGSTMRRFVPMLGNIPIYLCGPDAMMDATRSLLVAEGVSSDHIKTEAFVSPGVGGISRQATEGIDLPVVLPDKADADLDNARSEGNGTMRSINFSRSRVVTDVEPDCTLLEAAEECSIELPFECRSGVCGQCKTRLLKGTVRMDNQDALSPHEQRNGWILACQSHAQSNIVVDA